MIKEYGKILDENYRILKLINDNDLKDKIVAADEEAKRLSKLDGNQFLHSYRFSKIYDVLNNNPIDRQYTINIVNIVENSFDKSIDEILSDFNELDYEDDFIC